MANLPWFKIHNEFLTDPKLRRYFSKSERCDWINLLCLANTSKERGVILIPSDEISYALDLSDEEWQSLLDKLILRRMVALRGDGAVVIINWEDRQYDKPSDRPEATAERQAKSRANRQNHASSTPSAPVSRDVTPCHATEERRGDKSRVEKNPLPPPTSSKAKTAAVTKVQGGGGSGEGATSQDEWDTLDPGALLKRFRAEYPERELQLSQALASATKPVASQAAYLAPLIRRIVRGEEPEPIKPDLPDTVPRPGSRLARQQASSLIAPELRRMGYFEDAPTADRPNRRLLT